VNQECQQTWTGSRVVKVERVCFFFLHPFEWRLHTTALSLYTVLDTADAVPEAGLGGAQALVRRAQVLEFVGEALLQLA